MNSYRSLLYKVLYQGDSKQSRAGPVVWLPHQSITHDLRFGFPAITGRRFAFDVMAAELDCFIHGATNIDDFHARGCHIWDLNLKDFNQRTGRPDNKELGPIYGSAWRDFAGTGVDQLKWLTTEARRNPQSRRLLVTAWNPSDARDDTKVALPPCHVMWQLSVSTGYADLCFYMRSVDLALGLPFDIASYGLLLALICHELGLRPRYVTGFLADAHIYVSNFGGVKEYLHRPEYPLAQLEINTQPGTPVTAFQKSHVSLRNYVSGDPIKMAMAV